MSQTMTAPSSASSKAQGADRPFVYVNGQIVPKSQAAVNVFDHGLLYGDGVFEGIRVYRGKIFKCGQHLDRLWKCAERIRLKIHISRAEMEDVMRRCIEANELVDGYIRLIVTRGVGTLGLHPFRCPVPGIVCIADQIALYPPEMYRDGMRLVVANRPRISVDALDPRIKSLNYLNNILAKIEAIDLDCLEVVMLNEHGRVSEGSGDNIFMVKGGKVITPNPEEGILEGITRKFVIEELCPALGIPVEERPVELKELLAADEVFLTGSAAEIIAATQIDQHKDGKVTKETKISAGEGPVTKRLREKFRQIVTTDPIPED